MSLQEIEGPQFKKGDKVRIFDPWNPQWHGKEGIVTLVVLNGVMMQFPNGNGTMVKFNHLQHV